MLTLYGILNFKCPFRAHDFALLLIVYPKLSVIISCRLQHLCFLQLENYAKTEEAKVEELINSVADSGAKVIASGGAVGDMALHFCERYKSVFFFLMDRYFLYIFLLSHMSLSLKILLW
jgi:hypothetical protein